MKYTLNGERDVEMGKSKGIERLLASFVEIAMFSFRLLFFVYIIFDLYIEKDTVPDFYLNLIWILAAMFLPLCFWVPYLIQKRSLFCVVEMLLSGSLAIHIVQYSHSYTNVFSMSALSISFLLEKRVYWLIIVLAAFPIVQLFMKGFIFDSKGDLYFYLFDNWFILCVGLGLNLIIKSYKKTEELNGIIAAQNQALIQHAKQIETLTLVEERDRMSRDLHDTLGHSFISFIMGLDAIMYLVDSKPDLAKTKIEELRNLATLNLEKIRSTIHQIGIQTDIQITDSFSTIIQEFSNYTSTEVTFHVTGDEYYLHHSMRMALLRCLQESLTNAKKHGQATHIHVTLAFLDNEIQVTIQDNGKGTDQVEFGFGLTSMRERVETLNGELLITSVLQEGTRIKCSIPYRR
ncbi:sensor histidine kinase [Brevibacillus ginsengisoli]|uniref:sensor histidine kinase n=1 Tax=Brevibacillus ginsengisoli TaxID=363854 RepID=UPI003CF7B2FD